MKICNNCSTVNESDAIQCSHCAMKNSFVDYLEVKKEKRSTIKPIYETCSNCGTREIGNGMHCAACNFPLEKKADSTNKIKRSAS